jgi:hypothetical protein
MAKRAYTREEADAILARALDLQGRGDSTSHDDLVAAGREVGVSREAIDRAAEELLSARRDDSALREIRARAWRGFFAHLVPYALVNVLLAFTNALTGPPPWVLFVTFGWGIGLGSHLLAVANPDPRKLRRRLEWERRLAARETTAAVRVGLAGGPVRVRTGGEATGSEVDEEADAAERHAETGVARAASPPRS